MKSVTNFKFRYDREDKIRNMSELKPMELRFIISDQIDNDKNIFWNYPEEFGSKNEWKEKMKQNAIFCDEIFIQLASNMLKRIIILIPVFGNGQVKISPQFDDSGHPPYYLLYYSETRFQAGHYESIRPIDNLCSCLCINNQF